MYTNTRRRFLTVLGGCVIPWKVVAAGQQAFEARELAEYRLGEPVFTRFAHATRLLARVMRQDERFTREPLITRDISVSGDVAEMANALWRRLDADAALTTALFAADISSRDYAAFAIALFAARLAHGFVRSGAIRRVPPGVATDNVAFVDAHEREIVELLKLLSLE